MSGDAGRLYAVTPETTAALRALTKWADDHFPGDNPRTGREVTIDPVEYGYFLHRLFEVRPDRLEDGSG